MRAAIQAGAAFVELFVRDEKLREGLDRALGETRTRLQTMSRGTEATRTAHAATAGVSAPSAPMPHGVATGAVHAATAGATAAATRQVTAGAVGAQATLRGLGAGLNRLSWALSNSSKLLGALAITGRLATGSVALGLRAAGAAAGYTLQGVGVASTALAKFGGAAVTGSLRMTGSVLRGLGAGADSVASRLYDVTQSLWGGFGRLGTGTVTMGARITGAFRQAAAGAARLGAGAAAIGARVAGGIAPAVASLGRLGSAAAAVGGRMASGLVSSMPVLGRLGAGAAAIGARVAGGIAPAVASLGRLGSAAAAIGARVAGGIAPAVASLGRLTNAARAGMGAVSSIAGRLRGMIGGIPSALASAGPLAGRLGSAMGALGAGAGAALRGVASVSRSISTVGGGAALRVTGMALRGLGTEAAAMGYTIARSLGVGLSAAGRFSTALAGVAGTATRIGMRVTGSLLGPIGRGLRGVGASLSAPFSAAAGGFARLGGIAAKNYVTSWKLWFAGRLATRAGAGGAAAAAAGPAAGMLGAAAPGGMAAGPQSATARMLAAPAGATSAASAAIRSVGMRAMGAGAAMAAFAVPIALLTARFTSLGKEVYDASKKTGVSVETLSGLRYIGQQTGVSFDAMAAAAGEMGAKSPAALADVADKLDKIKDPAARAAEATRLLGDEAPALAPALALGGAALRKLADDARTSGSVVSAETAKLANAVATGAKRLAGEAKAGWDQLAISIGGALIGELENAKAKTDAMVGGIRGAVRGVTQWIAANKGLAANIVQGVAVVGLLGTALVAAGGALTLLGSSAAAVAGFLGALLSPTVLITAALAAGAYAWARYTATGQAAVAVLKEAFGPLVAVVKDAIGGIMDALTAGDLSLAGRIAFGGLKLAALEALGGVAKIVDSVFSTGIGQSIKDLTADLVSGNFSQIGEDLLNLWGNVVDGIVGMMARAVNGVINLWRGMVSGIANSLVKMATQEGAMGRIARTIVGRDLRGKMAPETKEQQDMRRRNLEEAQGIRKQELAKATAAGDQEAIDKWTAAIAKGEQELAAIGQAGADMLGEASDSVARQTAQWGSGAQDYLNSLKQTAEQRAAQRNDDRATERKEQGLPGFEDMLERERAAQAALLGEAADKAAKARAAAEAGAEGGGEEEDKKKGRGISSGSGATFSAAAAQFLGGASAQERTARNTEKAVKVMEHVANLDEQILQQHKIDGVFVGVT